MTKSNLKIFTWLLWALAAFSYLTLLWTSFVHPQSYDGHLVAYRILWFVCLLLSLLSPFLIRKECSLPVKFLLSAGFFAYGADQAIKWLIVSLVKGGPKLQLLPQIFQLTYAENPGAILGLLPGHRFIFITSGILTTFVVLFYYRFVTAEEKMTQVCLALVLAGALANMTDRIFLGYVIDMFEVSWQTKSLTIFNLADIFIDGGVLLIALDVAWNGLRTPEEPSEAQPQK